MVVSPTAFGVIQPLLSIVAISVLLDSQVTLIASTEFAGVISYVNCFGCPK
ncbi:MAG: hypothetical protein MJ219_00535 [Mycoplasmoidaceae bacterium]|nr:hypothetical protein [Mycoplasmoidaceae bacterium]